jgi:hypothetical protein
VGQWVLLRPSDNSPYIFLGAYAIQSIESFSFEGVPHLPFAGVWPVHTDVPQVYTKEGAISRKDRHIELAMANEIPFANLDHTAIFCYAFP